MKILISLFFILSLQLLTAQNTGIIEQILSQNRTEIDQIHLSSSNSVTLVPSIFAKNDVEFKRSIEELKELTIVKVYYVYTTYRKSPSFNQLSLDRKRFELLNSSFPEIIEDPYIEWELVEQTGCQSPEMGRTFFHGFVVIHRSIRSEAERLEEIARLESYLKNPTNIFLKKKLDILEDQLNPTTSTSTKPIIIADQQARFIEGPDAMLDFLRKELRTDEIALKRDDQWVKTHIKIDKLGIISAVEILDKRPERIKATVIQAITAMPNWEPAYRDSIPVDSELDLEVRVSYSPNVNGMYLINGERPTLVGKTLEEKPSDLIELYDGSTPEEIFMKQAPVYKGLEVLDRHERTAMVMDVTGSMTEHVAAMKRWIQANNDSLNFTSFTFFNDGDGKATKKKKIGNTGGVYTTFNLVSIDNLVTETMRRGSGGERPESDIEALLHTLNKDTLCDAILLIGDNYSGIRDIELLPNVTKKVNILMCSIKGSLRPDYLLIAKNTGGYLIYNGERIDLKNLRSGEILSVGNFQYDYNGRGFKVRKTSESSTRMNSKR
ncbi:MAG: hypothetical protein HRT58_03855 [Crocinitomicaceae bacterium]|nr:hypothetical protein [Flavobacteriales bacterium]NQZ34769.1 hypothetical protein [Crocinitomicaceae bacterium]